MYPNYKRPRFTEYSDEEDEEHIEVKAVTKKLCTNSAETLSRTYPIIPSRKRRRFTEESDEEEDEELLVRKERAGGGSNCSIECKSVSDYSVVSTSSSRERTDSYSGLERESIGELQPKDPLLLIKKPPPKSILKQPSIPNQEKRRSTRGPPTEPEYRKVFISNIDASRPVDEVRETLLNLMKTHGIPCEDKVHILPPNIGGRQHRGVAWITLHHQDDIDKAINRLNRTMFGTRLMKAKVHENPMLFVTKAQASALASTPTFSVRRGGHALTPLNHSAVTPQWLNKPTIAPLVPWVKKESGGAKKIFIWNIDNNKSQKESESFIYQTLAAELGTDVVENVSCRSSGMKAYGFVEFTRSNYVSRALEIINGLKFGIKHLGAQVHQSRQQGNRQSKDLDFIPW